MTIQPLWRPLRPLVHQSTKTHSIHTHSTMSGAPRTPPKQTHGYRRPQKRPWPTHFLCLPLVNGTSLPQLESSITAFREAHPPVPASGLAHDPTRSASNDVSGALLPEGSVRPLGTLHLTLGVMSLPSKDRFNEAISFFQSLDLESLMLEAERVAAEQRQRQNSTSSALASNQGSAEAESRESPSGAGHALQPLTISLQSLRALPRSKAATVLHASPVDSTGRLYPFCVMLRDKFIEAGFLLGETDGKKDEKQTSNGEAAANPGPQSTSSQPDSGPTTPLKALDPYTAAITRKPKPRPLLLHTTIVNTIYVRGGRRPDRGAATDKRNNKWLTRIEIDARDLIARYQNYYLDEARTIPRLHMATTAQSEGTGSAADTSALPEIETSIEAPPLECPALEIGSPGHRGKSSPSNLEPGFPFLWAKDIPIESVCICEMGAKKLDTSGENGMSPETRILNARLGEEYTVVMQRDLNFSRSSSCSAESAGEK